uniref:BTB domain-containing protein n=1 Tax=Panagrolaimus davidi TaxID=227884 RepID=A0A914P9X1_9BILA
MKPSSSFNQLICQFENEWKFRKEDLMNLPEFGCLNGKVYYAYNIPGLQYHVQIYPTGMTIKNRGRTQIRFDSYYYCEPELEIEVFIESINFSKSYSSINANGGGYTWKTADFFNPKNKLFVNGELTIKVKGIIKVPRPSTPIISSYICAEWKINEQDLKEQEQMEESTDDRVIFKEITVPSLPGIKLKLEFFSRKIQACSYFFIHGEPGNETKGGAVLDYSIDSANYNEQFSFVFGGDKYFAIRLGLTDNLLDPTKKRFFVNGVLTINLKGIFMVEKHQNDQFKTLTLTKSFALKSAWKRKNKDFLIVIGDKEIHVHKKVLLAASKSMIGNKETFDNKMVINDFPYKIVDIAVKLIYGKSVMLKSSLEDMFLLFHFGDRYRIQAIMDMIEKCLIREISPVNVVYLLKFSSPDSNDSTNVPNLYQECVEFFIKCLKKATPIYAAESLGEEFLESMFLKSILSNFTDLIN